jgi:menaquinone-dependent protoporphyrinogen oxidase
MKTLLIYQSKNGASSEIANRIAAQLGETVVYNLKDGVPSLKNYDCVIIGSPLYAGMVLKGIKSFVEQHAEELCGKKFALFLSGLDSSKEQEYFQNNFSPQICQAAVEKCFLGGIYDPKKVGFIMRLIVKKVAKLSAYTNTIDDTKIKKFAEVLTAETRNFNRK